MSKDLEHIDQLFKETLHNVTIPAPSGAWQAIASKSAAGSAASVGSAVIVKVAITAVLVAVSSLLIYTLTKEKPLEPKVKTAQLSQKSQTIDVVQEEKLVGSSEREESKSSIKAIPMVENKVETQNLNQKDEPQILPVESILFSENKNIKSDVFVAAESSKENIEVKIAEENPVEKAIDTILKTQIEKELRLFPNYFSPNIRIW